MLQADAMLKAAAALVATALGILVLATAPRHRATRWLGAFFALIALNQAAEVVRAGAVDALPAFRVATIAASLDPLVFWIFVQVLAHGRLRIRPTLLVGVPGFALALHAGWFLPPFALTWTSGRWGAALAGYTALVYFAATFTAVRALATRPRDPSWGALVAAGTLITLPPVVVFVDHGSFALPAWPAPGPRLVSALVAAGIVGYLIVSLGRRVGGADVVAPIRAGFAAALALIVLSKTLEIASTITGIHDEALPVGFQLPGRASSSIKWLVFGALVSRAVFRHSAVVAPVAARRRAARALVALGFLVAAVLGLSLLSIFVDRGGVFPWLETGALLAAIALSQAFQRVVDRVAARVYGVPVGAEAPTGADEPLRAGVVIGERYEIERFVARGGAGRVFLARDRLIGRPVAIKETPAAVREARAAARVTHPGIVGVFDVIPREGGSLLVTEYVEGGSLADRTEREGRIGGDEGLRLAFAIVETVASIHAHGLVHGDLKPANVLLDHEGRPKIADFGLAQSLHGTTSLEPAGRGGTRGYVAPEILRGAPATARADVYALGVVLSQSLDVPGLGSVAERARAEDPMVRFADAGKMAEAMRAQRQ